MRTLVTGATGFLGGHLASALEKQGHEVVAVVRDHTPESEWSRNGLHESCSAVHGEITDYRLIERALHEHRIEWVFQLASQTQVPTANASPIGTFETNIRGTYTVLEACRTYGKCARVVVASSDKAYGSQTLPYHEGQSLAGRHPYDVSKSCTDLIAQSYAAGGLPVVVARCSNLYGPADMNWLRVLPCAMRFAWKGEPMTLRGGGRMKRDYLYIDDAVRAYIACAENPKAVGQAFNFGTGLPVELIDFVGMALKEADCDRFPVVEIESRGEITDQWMDCGKAETLLGWTPSITLTDGLRESVAWYKALLS